MSALFDELEETLIHIYFLLNISISIIHLHGNPKTRNIETAIDLRAMGVNLGLNKQTLRLDGSF